MTTNVTKCFRKSVNLFIKETIRVSKFRPNLVFYLKQPHNLTDKFKLIVKNHNVFLMLKNISNTLCQLTSLKNTEYNPWRIWQKPRVSFPTI